MTKTFAPRFRRIEEQFRYGCQNGARGVACVSGFLKNDLAKRHDSDWRLGRAKYEAKFRYVLETDRKPDEILAEAEADLKTVRGRMQALALLLHPKLYPGKPAPKESNRDCRDAGANRGPALDARELYRRRQGRSGRSRNFVREKGLLKLPPRDNLQVIETPVFMRGIYAVGGFNAAPALEPKLGAFYWVTPIPETWPRERVESKLREYNFYKLKLLTIHEAMPGHYVQMEYANDVEPRPRRLLRSVFGNGPYIEGWAQYSEQMMLDEGLLDNSPELRLDIPEGRAARAGECDYRYPAADRAHDRSRSAGPDDGPDVPGEGRGHGEAAARQVIFGATADVSGRMARLEPSSRAISKAERRELQAIRVQRKGVGARAPRHSRRSGNYASGPRIFGFSNRRCGPGPRKAGAGSGSAAIAG